MPVQKQIPPTSTTMGPGGQPQYVGPRAQPQAPVPSGPAIGQVEGTVGPIQVANKHFEGVTADAQQAPTRISALQTIKQEADTAITSGMDWRRKFVHVLSGGVELDSATANDIMQKNAAMLAANGQTDAARALNEMSTPNVKMTKEAIRATSDALISMEKMKIAAQQVFAGISTNDPRYGKLMVQWNKAADPRLFEYAGLPAERKKEWLSRLSPGVRAELSMKAAALEKMGVEP
jgi:hypothetical protein